jgi:hypothetical protein
VPEFDSGNPWAETSMSAWEMPLPPAFYRDGMGLPSMVEGLPDTGAGSAYFYAAKRITHTAMYQNLHYLRLS